jgi:hypothetical protein
MSDKNKSADIKESTDPYLDAGKNPDLEKKVDELLSTDPPQPSGPPEIAKTSKAKKIAVTEHVDPEPVLELDKIEAELKKAIAKPTSKKIMVSDTAPELDEPLTPEPELEEEAIPLESEDSAPILPIEPPEPIKEIEPEKVEEKAPVLEKLTPLRLESPTKRVDEFPVTSSGESTPTDALGLEDPKTSRMVDDIIAGEADELFAARDNGGIAGPLPKKPEIARPASPSRKHRSRKWLAFKLIFLIIIILLAAAAITPTSRYLMLNTAGVRSAASVTVLDDTTGQPLKNAEFKLADISAKTNDDGSVRLENVKLGPTSLTIKKPGFAEESQAVTIGWGSNPLGDFRLKAVGNQYKFVVTDFLSKKPISFAEITSGDASAQANKDGQIVLTIPKTESDSVDIEIGAENYRIEKRRLTIGLTDTTNVELVPSAKNVFISNRAGTYDVYKIDVDGRNEEKVMAGTGKERPESFALSLHPSGTIAALVSTRDNTKTKDGFVLSTLTILNIADNTNYKVTQSERVQLIGWFNNRIVYVKIAEGESAASPNRHRLISYDINSKAEKELASTNYFNDVLAVNDSIYYTPSSYNVNGSVGLYKTNADGSQKRTVYDKEIWNLFRTSYDKLSVSMGQEWFELTLSNDSMARINTAPPVQKSRLYADNPGNTHSLWVDERDGKGVLINFIKESKEDKVILSQAGLKTPVRWLGNNYLVYRIKTNAETADYIINLDGGSPRKIRDVSDSAGIDRWYYY